MRFKLTCSADYDVWYENVKAQAKIWGVWQYMDERPDIRLAEPQDTFTEEAIRQIVTDFPEDPERWMHYEFLKIQQENYRWFQSHKETMMSLLYESLSNPIRAYLISRDTDGTLYETMALIARRVAPTTQQRHRQITADAKRLETYGTKAKLDWALEWRILNLRAERFNHMLKDEIKDKFIEVLQSLEPNLAPALSISKDSDSFEQLVCKYEDYIRITGRY